jgi:multidrug resistance efflux pump
MTATDPANGRNGRGVPRRLIIVTVLAVLIGGGAWLFFEIRGAGIVDLDDASITAPQVDIRALAGGTLDEVDASIGDEVAARRPLARVGNEVISADVTGTVISIREDLGAQIAPGTVVASVIEPDELRAVGLVDEDAGLSELRVGQRALIKVDALPGQEFWGSVEEISQRPHKDPVSFSIADRDEAQKYEVKVRFDDPPLAELRQGMSAEIEVHR